MILTCTCTWLINEFWNCILSHLWKFKGKNLDFEYDVLSYQCVHTSTKMHCIVYMHMLSRIRHFCIWRRWSWIRHYNQVPVHNDGAISVNLRSKYMLDQWHVFFFGAVGSFQGRWYNVCLINRCLVCLVGALTFKVIVYSFAQEVYHRVIRILSCSKSSSEYRNLSYIRACATYIQK